MYSLIVPCAGKSSRYGLKKPKWALTHPSGNLMLEEALRGIQNPEQVDCIYFAFLKEHQESLRVDFNEMILNLDLPVKKVNCVVLEGSSSQVDTVRQIISKNNIYGHIAIKDCDNYFNWNPIEGNSVACMRVGQSDDIRFLQQKSFISENPFKIVEKKIISDAFCVGGYTFNSALEFYRLSINCEYISEVITKYNSDFELSFVSDYLDWGNIESWRKYKSSFKTIFLDIDGVILENGSKHFGKKWHEVGPIHKNVSAIKALRGSHIVLTTARPESLRGVTEAQLRSIGLKFNHLIMGLPAAKRVLINDFDAASSPYPTAISVNIQRNSTNLDELLSDL